MIWTDPNISLSSFTTLHKSAMFWFLVCQRPCTCLKQERVNNLMSRETGRRTKIENRSRATHLHTNKFRVTLHFYFLESFLMSVLHSQNQASIFCYVIGNNAQSLAESRNLDKDRKSWISISRWIFLWC